MLNTLNDDGSWMVLGCSEIYMEILLNQISLDPSLPLYMPSAALKSA